MKTWRWWQKITQVDVLCHLCGTQTVHRFVWWQWCANAAHRTIASQRDPEVAEMLLIDDRERRGEYGDEEE